MLYFWNNTLKNEEESDANEKILFVQHLTLKATYQILFFLSHFVIYISCHYEYHH